MSEKVALYCGNTKKLIARMWYVTLLFTVINVICSFIVLSDTGAESGFTAIWSMFMTLSVAAGGTLVFRKYQTPGAVGFLLGVIVMMCQMFFMLFVVFLSFAGSETYGAGESTDRAYAAFAFLLMLCYGCMAFVIGHYRGDLIPSDPSKELPPPKRQLAQPPRLLLPSR